MYIVNWGKEDNTKLFLPSFKFCLFILVHQSGCGISVSQPVTEPQVHQGTPLPASFIKETFIFPRTSPQDNSF